MTISSFVEALQAVLDDKSFSSPDRIMQFATAQELLDVIECVSKFSSFAEGMKIKAVQFLSRAEDDAWEFGRRD